MKQLVFVFAILAFFSCKSQKQVPGKVAETISETYFEGWVAGVRGGGAGINFHVNFNEPLPKDAELKKVAFKGKEADFSTQDGLHYTAFIQTKKGGGSNAEGEDEPSEVLSESTAAKLYFTIKGHSAVHKLENVKEKEMLLYPSMNKPR